MECRRYVPGPEIYHPDRECDCFSCAADDRRTALIDELEVSLRRPIVQLLDSGMMPAPIAAAVRERTPKKSRAWMLTRVELTHQAGYWLSHPDWSDQLDEADQLAKHTGFKVGLTIPGWMQDWATRKGWIDDDLLTTSVSDVWASLAPELDASMSFARPDDGAWDLVAGRSSPPRNVVRLPMRRTPDDFEPWMY